MRSMDALDGEVEFALGELRVAQGEVAGEVGRARSRSLEERVVDLGGAAFGLGWTRRTCRRSL